ncbi:hypothetical protein V6U78_06835 [Marinospirillum sp. MEB164]|uniref:Peptidase C-terminal archaeal/bacterial domain-containing protein n=1 Tax=Marinospirillum alkalitolerans TaxID=3123374 RepID=A0ABW8PY43_9GAMM
MAKTLLRPWLCVLALCWTGHLFADFPEDFIRLETQQPYFGQLGDDEPQRFYFVLEQAAQITLESSTLARINNVHPEATLFNADGRRITSDRMSGQGRNFRIQRHLEAGTYVLRVDNGRPCGSLYGCPNVNRDYQILLDIQEPGRF